MIYLRLSPLPDMPIDIAQDGATAYRLVLVSNVLAAFHESIISRNDNAFFSRAVKVLCLGDRSTGMLKCPDHPIAAIWPWARAILEVCNGVQRLAVWLIDHDLELHRFTRNSGRLRPTHMSLDITNHSWHAILDWVKILPESLTHLNLDCENNQDIKDIPWLEVFAWCPNLAHMSLSGYAVSAHFFDDGELFSVIVPSLMSQLPATVATFTMVMAIGLPYSRDKDRVLENQLDAISEASDRFVVVSHDFCPRRQIRSLQAFEEPHAFDSEWGRWRGEDTWDLAQKCVANRLKKYDERNTPASGLISSRYASISAAPQICLLGGFFLVLKSHKGWKG
ncbi:hypothetical protein BDZ89DRAFT_1073985 [Hymenopellis radicata]|nr:hypothetical protein BDZ89DRAFT_1073985 [Hymenopellis radicata]